MIRSLALLLVVGCLSVRIEADGATTIRSLGAIHVETQACDAPTPLPREDLPSGPLRPAADWHLLSGPFSAPGVVATAEARTCVRIQGASLSQSAGNLIAGILGLLIGR